MNQRLCAMIAALSFSTSAAATNLNDIQPSEGFSGIEVHKLATSPQSTDFVIFIQSSVPLHLHETHAETVLILEGEALFTMADSTQKVGAGDYVKIPAGTPHGVKVTSDVPLKVLSVQAPEFFGKDRVLVKAQ